MEHHVNRLTLLVNHYFGHFAISLLSLLHITPRDPAEPIRQHVVMAFCVLIVGTLVSLFIRARLSVEKPGATQQVAELLLTNSMGFGIRDLLEENTGHDGARYVPLVGYIAIFILISNLMGVFPFLAAPTGEVTVPLACALITFVYFNWQGMRKHGVLGYLNTFAGSPHGIGGWLLALLLFPVEIISTTAR